MWQGLDAQAEAAKVIKFLKKRHGKGGTKHSRALSLDTDSNILKRPISKRSCEQFVEYLKTIADRNAQELQAEDPDFEYNNIPLPDFTDNAANNVPIYKNYMSELGFALEEIDRKDWKK
ncbi:uncharacterized protein DSM5745_00313 [Aspergillus mulundensis]|uniref:Uncharacterized protein n=1 Tax=Aspergillus mulundensis TaxID=1810919 RepID=A0A3D8T3G0_9EURO|nr:hypothetical protein DSM5745_00313 [Aspergillus mulundensis]RDW92991.1 hypothetical protein DSM5745_00313 [Aspergillus mulundensis]